MKLKKFCNKTVIIEDLKRFFGVSILYFIAVFVSGPIYILSIGHINTQYQLSRILRVINEAAVHGSITGIAGIILGILLFRYLHNKSSVAVIHGYPFKRNELLNSHIVSGIILISIPMVLNTIILALTLSKTISNIDIRMLVGDNIDAEKIVELYSTKQAIYWFLKMEIIGIMTFLISAFTGIASGVTIIQTALAFILPFVPYFVLTLVREGLEAFIFGFRAIYDKWDTFAGNIIPILTLFDYKPLQLGYIIWYILLCISLYLLCLWMYKKRDLERAEDAIVFDILKPIFKYGVTFCATLLAGGYFYALKSDIIWLWLGVLGGSFLGYFISEMIMEKSVRVFWKFKGYILYMAVIVVVAVGIKIDVFGFERRIPSTNQVKEVYFNYLKPYDRGITEKKNIEAVIGIHRTIIDNKKDIVKAQKQKNNSRKTYITMGYLYTNGKRIVRCYTVPEELLAENGYTKSLYESQEYKRMRNKYLLELNLDEVDSVNIRSRGYDKRKTILNKYEIKEIYQLLKEEIFAETYESMIDENNWAGIEFDINGNDEYNEFRRYLSDDSYQQQEQRDVHINFKRAYFSLEKWFTQKGYLKEIRVMPEDIKYIVIQKANKNYIDSYVIRDYEIEQDLKMGGPKRIEVKDKEKIDEILRTNRRSWSKNMKYIVAIYTEDGEINYGWYDEENALKYFQ